MAIDIGDFRLAAGRVTLRRTGNSAALDRRLIAEVAAWAAFWVALRLTAPWVPRGPRVWFAPQRPARRYQVRQALTAAGLRLARAPDHADLVFAFEDATVGEPPAHAGLPTINLACHDISKSRVAAVFEASFGYPLALDPAAHTGACVEKGERNGAHDGQVVACPRRALPGRVYQRLIDNTHDGDAVDLRTQCADGRVVAVWRKRRPVAARFLPPNTSVEELDPARAYSPAELAAIARFCAAFGAEWCALDVLRDRDGRIYVVDVNRTDAGPIIALPLRAKLRAARTLGAALRAMVDARIGAP